MFRIYLYVSNRQNHYVNATETNLILTDLQGGTRTTIEVAVLSNGLMGDVVEIIEYTGNSSSSITPVPVSLLLL